MSPTAYLKNLGCQTSDPITGAKGTITSASFDLNGCIQYWLSPSVDKEGKLRDGFWIDEKRLKITSKPLMQQPEFVVIPGPEYKFASGSHRR